jgi:hypothetical protein
MAAATPTPSSHSLRLQIAPYLTAGLDVFVYCNNEAHGSAVQDAADPQAFHNGNEVVVKQGSGAWYTPCRSFLVYGVFRKTAHNLMKESFYG